GHEARAAEVRVPEIGVGAAPVAAGDPTTPIRSGVVGPDAVALQRTLQLGAVVEERAREATRVLRERRGDRRVLLLDIDRVAIERADPAVLLVVLVRVLLVLAVVVADVL